MSWFQSIRSWFQGAPQDTGAGQELPALRWIEAEDTIFNKRILDLTPVTHAMIATAQNPENAARAMSWGQDFEGLPKASSLEVKQSFDCALQYPVRPPLPRGFLFAPQVMEEKWVLFYTGEQILALRSWTGELQAVAETRLEGERLTVTKLSLGEDSLLRMTGLPVELFDWLIRSHALREFLPVPCTEKSLKMLEEMPLMAFSAFGVKAATAVLGWDMEASVKTLGVDGEVLSAVRRADLEALKALIERGEGVDVASSYEAFSPLFAAVMVGHEGMTEALLKAGADPNYQASAGVTPAAVSIVHGQESLAMLKLLHTHGADLTMVNERKFGLLHGAAEADKAELVPWLVEQGLDLEQRSDRDHSPLHIACGLGHSAVAKALIEAGAKVDAESSDGSPREVAEREGHEELVRILAAHD